MSGHYICDSCGYDSNHASYCKYLRPLNEQWLGNMKGNYMPTINSSMISEYEYHENEKILRLKFTKGGWYEYVDVPKEVAHEFIASDSKGKYFLANIKNKYEFVRY